MNAEALYRLGQNTDEALRLVNLVRTRSNCAPFTELSLDKIEKERARAPQGHDPLRFILHREDILC